MRRTVPPSAEIEKRIDELLAGGIAAADPGALSATESGLASSKSHRSPKPVTPADAVKDACPSAAPMVIGTNHPAVTTGNAADSLIRTAASMPRPAPPRRQTSR